MAAVVVFIGSIVSAPLVAWWITRRMGNEWWPIAAFALQLGLHVAWTGILAGHADVSDDLVLPLASTLGVLIIAFISALLRFAHRTPPRQDAFGVLTPRVTDPEEEPVFGVLTPRPVEPDEEPAPKLPRAQVVRRRGRRRNSAYRRRR